MAGQWLERVGDEQVGNSLEIYDMNAAAYLLTRDIELVEVVREAFSRWATFRFRNDDGRASEALKEFTSGQATANIQRFVSAYKHIRRMVFATA
jgi:hypothetical protein